MRLCAESLAMKYKIYDEWGQGKAMPQDDNDLSQDFEDLARDRFLIGSPDEVTEQILALHKRTGANHIVASMQWPGTPLQASMDAMQMLAEEVFARVQQGL